ncbi:hypothetical protein GCM10009558_066980 [Virgisporangium aurantiacum]
MTAAEINRLTLTWRIATRGAGGNCVEVAPTQAGVAVRHSREPDGEMIVYSKAEFAAFLDGAKSGEFDDLVH